MLREIHIQNLILVNELRLELQEGLNVLTGETGAGKSIIIDALGLLMGGRVSADMVREANRKAVVEGVFFIADAGVKQYLEENGLADVDDDLLILRREIGESGRSINRINGRTVTLQLLKELGERLVDIHLQHDNQLLLHPRMYIHYMDSFNPDVFPVLEQVRQTYDRWQERQRELDSLLAGERRRTRDLDLIRFQIQEIESLELVPGEEEELVQRRDRIRDAGELGEGARHIYELVYGSEQQASAYDLVAQALQTAHALKRDDFFSSLVTPLEECLYTLEDIGGQVAEFKSRLEFEPRALEEIEGRLEALSRLKRKYGDSIPEILRFLDEARQEQARLESSEQRVPELQEEVEDLRVRYHELCAQLSEYRRRAKELLEVRVHQELSQLGMPGVRFEVSITPRENTGRDGMDQVTFLFSANPGEEPRPLARVASGGEVSRLVLALKKVLAEVYEVPTLIFDEIDVGVGGSALNAMAKKLYEIACHHQVILVTHSPQVASFADCHYLLEKAVEGGTTVTYARKLTEAERVKEIARMLSGEASSRVSLEHSREILATTAELKNQLKTGGIETTANG